MGRPRYFARAWVAALALSATPAVAGEPGAAPAVSAPGDAQTTARDQARAIAREGLDAFDHGRYAEALERFDRAEALVPAATLGLMAARALERLGRWVAAAERYRRVAASAIPADASVAMRSAPEKAARELAALVPRLGWLEIDAPLDSVTLDGVAHPGDFFATPRPLDPGTHHLVWSRAGHGGAVDFSCAEGERRRLVVAPASPAAARAPAAAPRAPAARIAGATLLTLGSAALLAGGAVGIAAALARGHLDDSGCERQVCPPELEGDVAHYNSLRIASGATLATGAALGGAGLALVLTAPSAGRGPSALISWQHAW